MLSPLIVQVGLGFTDTFKEHSLGQPSRVMLSVTVNVPEAPAVTLTEEPSLGPVMVPSPLIDQLCVTVPPVGSTDEV